MPICKVCQQDKPYAKGRHKCQDCLREYHRRWYALNHSDQRKAQRSYGFKLRKQAVMAYGGKCECCGESEMAFLALDHIHNDGNEKRKLHGKGPVFYRWLQDSGYPKGVIQVLCHNCNQGKHINGGICPHQQRATTIPKGSRAKRPEAPNTQNG